MDSTSTNRLPSLKFGRQTFPDEARAVWGARLIAPADLLHDRQDLQFRTDEDKKALVFWLNGTPVGQGALWKARENLRENPMPNNDMEGVLYEDEIGKIVGSCQSSYGYVYICGWLK